eukprot:scaffold6685_cov202-Prasinococcus_capsulatus_cf.AAC.1
MLDAPLPTHPSFRPSIHPSVRAAVRPSISSPPRPRRRARPACGWQRAPRGSVAPLDAAPARTSGRRSDRARAGCHHPSLPLPAPVGASSS